MHRLAWLAGTPSAETAWVNSLLETLAKTMVAWHIFSWLLDEGVCGIATGPGSRRFRVEKLAPSLDSAHPEPGLFKHIKAGSKERQNMLSLPLPNPQASPTAELPARNNHGDH